MTRMSSSKARIIRTENFNSTKFVSIRFSAVSYKSRA